MIVGDQKVTEFCAKFNPTDNVIPSMLIFEWDLPQTFSKDFLSLKFNVLWPYELQIVHTTKISARI